MSMQMSKVADVLNLRNKINVRATVKSKGEPRTVNLKAGGSINVCDTLISDETGEIKFQLWGDDIALVNVNDTIEIRNGYTTSFKGEISLGKGKFGELQVNP